MLDIQHPCSNLGNHFTLNRVPDSVILQRTPDSQQVFGFSFSIEKPYNNLIQLLFCSSKALLHRGIIYAMPAYDQDQVSNAGFIGVLCFSGLRLTQQDHNPHDPCLSKDNSTQVDINP
jgi:hypothetical protein